MALFCVGLNHKLANLSLRERFAVHDLGTTLDEMRSQPGIHECALISTCNRTEWIVEAPHFVAVQAWFQSRAESPPLYCHEGESAALHLMQVAVGLDSMMVGETQIFGQIKAAFGVAQERGTLGPVLNRLAQMTFHAAKKARHETNIGANAVSMGGAAVRLANQIFASLADTRILLLGAGETVQDVLTHLVSRGCGTVLIASRQLSNATALAKQFQAEAVSLSAVHDYLHQVDMIITATRSTLPLIGKGAIERAMKARKHKPLLLIDLGVPRDIEPEVNLLPDVYLYNIDDLSNIVLENKATREAAGVLAESLLAKKAEAFAKWYRLRHANSLIASYRMHADALCEAVQQEAMAMLKAGMSSEKVLAWQSRTLAQKLLHLPTERLKSAEWSDDPSLLDRMIAIFKHT